jgi:glycosyltransferase involved in cell wall biosynthesis
VIPGEPPAALGVVWLTERDTRNRAHTTLAKAALRKAALVWGYSASQLDLLEHEWGVAPSRLRLLHWGIDSEFWRANGQEPGPGVVVSAGNDRHRDHRLLLSAVLGLREGNGGLRFEIATKDRLALPASVGTRHTALSHPEMRDLYGRASVVAVATVPNHHLAGITVVLEAMACERPIVVSDTPGMSEYVKHGETGLLVPPGDRDKFAEAIDALVREPERAREMGRAARRSIEARFSTTMLTNQLADALRDALK